MATAVGVRRLLCYRLVGEGGAEDEPGAFGWRHDDRVDSWSEQPYAQPYGYHQ